MLIEQEALFRLSIFLFGLTFFWIVGVCFPYRNIRLKSRRADWFKNLSMFALNTTILRLIAPISLTAIAVIANEMQLGILNQFHLSETVKILLAFLLLDIGIYWQHRLLHEAPFLWRLHRLHHTDTELDVTTAGRFHLLEIVASFTLKIAMVLVIGAPAVAIIIFEVALNFCSMFNHANISLSAWLERSLRVVLVTPDMHRIHHSSNPRETNSNYSSCLSCWDRIFKSYTKTAQINAQQMQIGLKEFRQPEEQAFKELLINPFR